MVADRTLLLIGLLQLVPGVILLGVALKPASLYARLDGTRNRGIVIAYFIAASAAILGGGVAVMQALSAGGGATYLIWVRLALGLVCSGGIIAASLWISATSTRRAPPWL
jgi:hypothetical protein